jgi:hypothetical protein
MSIEINKVDTFQTRLMQSFVNLTQLNSTTYPAVTTVRIEYPENCTSCEALTSISIYDQWAFRTKAVS